MFGSSYVRAAKNVLPWNDVNGRQELALFRAFGCQVGLGCARAGAESGRCLGTSTANSSEVDVAFL